MVGDLSTRNGARPSPVQFALDTGSNLAAAGVSQATPSASKHRREYSFLQSPTIRACSAAPQRSPLKTGPASTATPQKQTTLPFTPTKNKTGSPLLAPQGARLNGLDVARAERSTAAEETKPHCDADAPKKGTPHAVASKVVNLISDDSSSSSEECGGDAPGAQVESSRGTLAAKPFNPTSGGETQKRKCHCVTDGGGRDEGPDAQPMRAEPRGSSSRIVVDLLSSDEDGDVQQQNTPGRAADGAPASSEQNEPGAGDVKLPPEDAAAASDAEHHDPDSGDDPMPSDGALFFQTLVEEQTTNRSEQAKDAEMQCREAEAVGVQNSPPRTRCRRAQASNLAVQSGQKDHPMRAEHEDGAAFENELGSAGRRSDAAEAVAAMNSGHAPSDPVATTARLCTSAQLRGEQDDHRQVCNGTELKAMAQALSGDPMQLNQRKEAMKRTGSKGGLGKGAQIRRDKQKRVQKQKSVHSTPNYDKKGPMLFHHIARQPFNVGLSATADLHRRIDREDNAAWQYWVTSLRLRMRQHSMSHEEAYYIFRFEHYRFWLPHSANALWPSVVEGFILRYRDWIQDSAEVREVCHAHLLHLTKLRLLAPMQTQHCLKVLNGTVTPCPDYMFDHLRPADPNPPIENDEEEELAEAEKRKEEAAVARLAALQKAAAGSKAVVGLKRPAPYAGPSSVGPAFDDGRSGELERLLGSVPADQVSVRVKEELQKLDETLATQPVPLDTVPASQTKQKVKLKIKRRLAPLPVLFRYVLPSEYPKVARRLIKNGRVRKLSDIDQD